jgi:hypothetical protein
MRKCSLLLICAAAFCSQISAQCIGNIPTGTYELKGCNDDSEDIHYKGLVSIEPFGTHYKLEWKIGDHQVQHGIGVVGLGANTPVLNVAYQDDRSKDFGMVTYSISSDGLDGTWISFYRTDSGFGREHLTWISPNISEKAE